MEQLTTIRQIFEDIKAFEGKQITLGGWVRTLRDSKNIGFIELNDGSQFKPVQVVFERDLPNYDTVVKMLSGAALLVHGTVTLTPQARQPLEIHATQIEIEGESGAEYPLQKKRHSFEFLREIAHLRPRANTFMAVYRVRSLAAHAIHCFFQERGFIYVHSPIITTSDAEGAGEMFHVTTLDVDKPPRDEAGAVDYTEDYFGRPAGLTVSGQLNAECFALSMRNVYTFGPTFRAEDSNTTRHASEFWMIEPEIAFADLDDDMALAEDMVKYIIRYVLEKAPDEMEFFNTMIDKGLFTRLQNVLDNEFGHVTYTEAVEILQKADKTFVFPVYWGCDLQTEHERYLAEEVFARPVFVTDYPKESKAFYMRLNEDNKTVRAMDLLVPGVGEIIGGSQREERYDHLMARLTELGMDPKDYSWYLDLRKYGSVRHAGYGLGFERILMYITGMANIRDVLPFPRTPGSAEF